MRLLKIILTFLLNFSLIGLYFTDLGRQLLSHIANVVFSPLSILFIIIITTAISRLLLKTKWLDIAIVEIAFLLLAAFVIYKLVFDVTLTGSDNWIPSH